MGRRIFPDVEAVQGEKPLYITEWFQRFRFEDQAVADRLGVSRVTVFRWRQHPHRLNPPKLSILAAILGIEPQDFWFHPNDPSVDFRLRSLDADRKAEVFGALKRLLNGS